MNIKNRIHRLLVWLGLRKEPFYRGLFLQASGKVIGVTFDTEEEFKSYNAGIDLPQPDSMAPNYGGTAITWGDVHPLNQGSYLMALAEAERQKQAQANED